MRRGLLIGILVIATHDVFIPALDVDPNTKISMVIGALISLIICGIDEIRRDAKNVHN